MKLLTLNIVRIGTKLRISSLIGFRGPCLPSYWPVIHTLLELKAICKLIWTPSILILTTSLDIQMPLNYLVFLIWMPLFDWNIVLIWFQILKVKARLIWMRLWMEIDSLEALLIIVDVCSVLFVFARRVLTRANVWLNFKLLVHDGLKVGFWKLMKKVISAEQLNN